MADQSINSFINFPKLELHAHLNGSLSEETINKLTKLNGDDSRTNNQFTIFKDLKECFEIFAIAHKATRNCDAVKLATLWTIKEFAEDGVVYLELRSTPREEPGMSKHMYLDSIIHSIVQAQSTIPQIIVQLLVSINRSESYQRAADNVDLAIEYAKKFPGIVTGIDFSGNPAIGDFKTFMPLLAIARSNGLRITLHCGEVDNDEEVDEMLNFAPDRLGHVTCLSQQHLARLKERKIPAELCLSSNVLCGTVRNFESHHVQKLYPDHPIILGTDDKGVFNTTLSNEYQIAQKFLNFTNSALYEMNWNAVNFIFSSDAVKEKLRKILQEWKDAHID